MGNQWRNVISGGPRFTIFEGPLVEASAKGTSRASYMHEFSRGSIACMLIWKIFESLKYHFLDFEERFYRILMVRKQHCNVSEALANVFGLQSEPGGPIWPIGVGGPRVHPVRAHSSYATVGNLSKIKQTVLC